SPFRRRRGADRTTARRSSLATSTRRTSQRPSPCCQPWTSNRPPARSQAASSGRAWPLMGQVPGRRDLDQQGMPVAGLYGQHVRESEQVPAEVGAGNPTLHHGGQEAGAAEVGQGAGCRRHPVLYSPYSPSYGRKKKIYARARVTEREVQ